MKKFIVFVPCTLNKRQHHRQPELREYTFNKSKFEDKDEALKPDHRL